MLSIPPGTLAAFVLTCMVIELTPGPNMAYLAVLGATDGRRAGFAAVAGVALGLAIVGLLAALGLAAAISASPMMFQSLRWAGVGYLLWLAWDAWREEAQEKNAFAPGLARYFRRGLIVNLLNPKAGVFYIAMLPQFVTPGAPVLAQTIALSLLFVVIATTIHGSIVAASGSLQHGLSSPGRRRIMRRLMAVALVLIAFWFAWSTGGGTA